MLVLEQCWHQKNADARGLLEKCSAQLGLGKVSSADLPRKKAVPNKLGWERCLGPGGLGQKLSQALGPGGLGRKLS
jgi:hypothetical protein